MSLKFNDKKAIVSEVYSKTSTAVFAALSDYRNLKSNQMNYLRRQARKCDIYIRVVRNSLLRFAFKNTSFECMQNKLNGPLILILSKKDPGKSARFLKEFASDNNNFEVKYLSINGELFNANDLDRLSKLPSHQESLVLLNNTLISAITNLIYILRIFPANIVHVFAVLSKVKK